MPKTKSLPNVPRWARHAATAVAWTNAPSGLWRLAIAAGIPVGLARSEYEQMHAPGWGSLYLVALSLVSEALALLALGLVREWGEVWPRWVPVLRGRPVPVVLATALAGFGALGTTVYGVLFVVTAANADLEATVWGWWLLNVVYAPLLLWGPLLAAVTVHYYRRRTAGPAPVPA
ncbi:MULTISPECIES: hypothetical protein [Streptomyces]|uniref:hypothetical protein n=1 Tax=Streptomyces TaxID=1883 RepID=UPI00163C8E85|nr:MULTISPECIES: hypothetical protein [Streptomyces]MBC2879222.1 hypothetical protein [Streptomyces sp. TYQ1024]UBI39806.1 hypothetical protein K7I03_27250 [Streptomyces mobaraensis]UKW32387.1 hypothetical protein MCU78_27185 [Streptomyces sp. TYQ1024]